MSTYEEEMAAAGIGLGAGPVEEIIVPQPDARVELPAPAELSPKRPTEAWSAAIFIIASKVSEWLDVSAADALLLVAGVPAAITWLVTKYRNFKR